MSLRDLGRAKGYEALDPAACLECGHDGDALVDEVIRLRQCIWDMCIELGMDNDGDPTPAHMTYPDITVLGLEEARVARQDYDAALDEITALEAAARKTP